MSLVIPCYNEEKGLPKLAARCIELAAATDCEVILVNNGSNDDSASVLADIVARSSRLRVVTVDVNQGYGFGILSGLKAATGDVIGFTHADMQTDPMDAAKGLALFEKSRQPERLLVKGRRYGRPFTDRAFTFGMDMFETILFGRVLTEVNAQPTLFPRSFFETWTDPPNDFSLDLFVYATAKQRGFSVRKFAVHFGPREHGQSNWNLGWSSRYKFIKRIVEYSFRLRRQFARTAR